MPKQLPSKQLKRYYAVTQELLEDCYLTHSLLYRLFHCRYYSRLDVCSKSANRQQFNRLKNSYILQVTDNIRFTPHVYLNI